MPNYNGVDVNNPSGVIFYRDEDGLHVVESIGIASCKSCQVWLTKTNSYYFAMVQTHKS